MWLDARSIQNNSPSKLNKKPVAPCIKQYNRNDKFRRKHQVIEIYALCIKGNVKNAEVTAVLVLVTWRID